MASSYGLVYKGFFNDVLHFTRREKTARRAAASKAAANVIDLDSADEGASGNDNEYIISDSDEDFDFGKSKATKKKPSKNVFDSDEETAAKKSKKSAPVLSVSSDDLFDSLIGKSTPKKEEPIIPPPVAPAPAADVFALGNN